MGIAVAVLLAAQRQPDDRPQHGEIGTERGRKTPCGRDLEAEKSLVWKEKCDLKLIITFSGPLSCMRAPFLRLPRPVRGRTASPTAPTGAALAAGVMQSPPAAQERVRADGKRSRTRGTCERTAVDSTATACAQGMGGARPDRP